MRRTSPQTLTAAVLIIFAAGLIALSLGGYLQPVRSLALRPVAAVQTWLSLRYQAIRDQLTIPNDVASLRERNAELEAQVSQLEQQVIALKEQLAETEILAALLNYARDEPENRYIAAPVIGRDVSPFLRSVWIGGGSDDGLTRGMPVVNENGLVGRVIEVFATVSRVELITDPQTAVNVRLQNSRTDGVLTAQLNGELWVDLIDQNAQVEPGELVITSGLGGSYPADIPVGQVINVYKRDYELFQKAVIQPNVDFDQLEIILVITNFRSFPAQDSGISP